MSQMIPNDVQKKMTLPEKDQDNVTGKKAVLASQGLKDAIHVLSYKMHTHQGDTRLLTLKKVMFSTILEDDIYLTSKHKDLDTSEHQLSATLNGFSGSKSLSGSYSHKNISLPFLASLLSDAATLAYEKTDLKRHNRYKNPQLVMGRLSLPRPNIVSSFSQYRGKSRKENLSVLKRSINPIWRSHQGLYTTNQGTFKKGDMPFFNTTKKTIEVKATRSKSRGENLLLNVSRQTTPKKGYEKNKSIWKGFTNTLMRHGNKLRYQTVLRKALSSALPEPS